MHGKQILEITTETYSLTSAFDRTNPSVADIATISIGGNDIGFYNILTACVLWVGGYWAGDCNKEVAKAYDILAGPDLSANITSALREIIDKNGHEAFRVYMTGYVTFFNETTTLCESSSFRIWNPHYDKSQNETGQPWLTTGLRAQLNGVVLALNAVLKETAEFINVHYANTERVIFVDPNSAYAGHRWCEEGVYEPDDDRLDTWLFLSSTPDNSLPDKPFDGWEPHSQEQQEQANGPNSTLPDPNTCKQTLAQSDTVVSHDWYGKSPIQNFTFENVYG